MPILNMSIGTRADTGLWAGNISHKSDDSLSLLSKRLAVLVTFINE